MYMLKLKCLRHNFSKISEFKTQIMFSRKSLVNTYIFILKNDSLCRVGKWPFKTVIKSHVNVICIIRNISMLLKNKCHEFFEVNKYILNKLTEFSRDTAKKVHILSWKKVKIFHQSKHWCIHNLISLPSLWLRLNYYTPKIGGHK